ncbi:enoyl-CoA hydratase/isomerase family protein [Flavobacterium soyangense]|uniref:Enoyl-CoA hydratase/isomerase family protein n=1 Tax=Flavobacterium soyangense TaxID=2023265 RepID=A0A930U5L7_9FLAO|nr:enoyl-CoA hydratase-related protein [Flavobacterium soyangense]MBF2707303.1 enoyl-CoA hydratase/isomerase family protein [Flavobacterium soyangense]
MALENIILEHEKGIATIFINRPEKLNALNRATIQELHETLKLVDENPEVRVIIITGSGEKAFVAGADISEFAHFTSVEGSQLAAQGQQLLFDFIENMKTPVIAAINGFALGGGLELAMACHFRIASENAKMGLPETSLGVIPGYGGTQRLPQIIGKGRAMEMIMTAGMIDAETAKIYGLVNHVVPQTDLFSTYTTIATRIIKNSPVAIAKAIEAVNANYISGVNGFDVEIKNFGDCFATDDFKEGTTAFLEKRKAEFK